MATILAGPFISAPTAAASSTPNSGLGFAPREELAVAAWPASVHVADVTGDGRGDLLATTYAFGQPSPDDHSLIVFPQLTNGSLGPGVRYAREGDGVEAGLGTGDLDDDGDADVAVATSAGVNIFRQAGGILVGPTLLPTSSEAREVVVADLTGDSVADMVVNTDTNVLLFTNQGLGTFAESEVGGPSQTEIELGDMDSDGDLDVVGWLGTVIHIFKRNPDGTFARLDHDVPGSSGGESLGVGDVTGDGRDDVVFGTSTPSPQKPAIAVLPQQAGGDLGSPILYEPWGSAASPRPLATADMNGDGRVDVVAPHMLDNHVEIRLQDASGSLGSEALYPAPHGIYLGFKGIALGDLSGDGRADMAVATSGGLAVIRQLASGQGASSATLTAADDSVDFGQKVDLTGSLRFPDGGSTAPQRVRILRTEAGGTPVDVGFADTTWDVAQDAGVFSFADAPPRAGDFTYQAVWDGDDGHQGTSSPSVTVTVSKVDPGLTVSAPNRIQYGKSLMVTIHLADHASNDAISLYATPTGGKKKLVASGPVDVSGNLVVTMRPAKNTKLVAEYAGDESFLPDSANDEVEVRVIVKGKLFGAYGKSGKTKLYHAGDDPVFGVGVTPNHTGKRIVVYVDVKKGGRWNALGSIRFKLGKGSVGGVQLADPAKGYKFRVQAWFNDSDHHEDYSPWKYFKVTN